MHTLRDYAQACPCQFDRTPPSSRKILRGGFFRIIDINHIIDMVVHIQVHPFHLPLCDKWIFHRRDLRKTLKRKHARGLKTKLLNLFFRQIRWSPRFRIHVDDMLAALRDHFPIIFACEFKTARPADSLPVEHPNGEVKNVVVTQWTLETNLGLANDPEHVRALAVFFTPPNCSTPIPCSLNEITQIIGWADSATGIQFSPTHTERVSKDFRHGIPLLSLRWVDFILYIPSKNYATIISCSTQVRLLFRSSL